MLLAPSPLRRRLALGLTGALAAGPARAQDPAHRDPDLDVRGPLAPVAEYPPELTPPPRIEVAQARRLTNSGQHAAAALLLEALGRELGDPRLLYHAAIARGRAGHHTLALQHLRRYLELAGPLSAELRAHIDARIADETARLVPVRIDLHELVAGAPQRVVPGPGARITLAAHDQRPLEVTASTPLPLDPGPWLVRVEVPGYRPVALEQRVEAGPGERTWDIRLERSTVALELRLGPPRALRRATLRLTATDRAGLAPIEAAVEGPTRTVALTTGAWQLTVSSPRHSAELALAVGPDPRPIDIVLRRRSHGDLRFEKDRKLVIGVTSALAVSFYTGVGLAIAGANVESKARKLDLAAYVTAGVDDGATPDAAALAAIEAELPTADLHRSFRRATNLQTASAAVMMSGLGAVLGLLPSLLRSRRRAGYIALGAGGAALIGGAVWMHDYVGRRDLRLDPTDPAHRVSASGLVGHRLGASMLTGLGIGLTIGSGVTLLTDHLRRRKNGTARLAPFAAPGHAGLIASGSF